MEGGCPGGGHGVPEAAGQTLCLTCPQVGFGSCALLPVQTPLTYRGQSESGWMPTSAWGKLGEHHCWVLKFLKKLRSCAIAKSKCANDKSTSRSLQK